MRKPWSNSLADHRVERNVMGAKKRKDIISKEEGKAVLQKGEWW